MEWFIAVVVGMAVGGAVYWVGTRLLRGWDQLQADARQVDRRDRERDK